MFCLGPLLHNTVSTPSGTAATAWDPTFNSNFGYTSANTVATRNAGSGDQLVKADTGKTSGTVTFTITNASADVGVGLGQAGTVAATWAGSAGTMAYHNTGTIFFNAAGVDTGPTLASGDTLTLIYDGTYVQYKKNGGANISTLNGGLGLNISGTITTAYPIASSPANVADAFAISGW